MAKLSTDFDSSEFDCPCGVCKLTGEAMDKMFIAALQSLRIRCNIPFKIISGIRCLFHNRDVGGKPSSLHLIGRAADIETPNGAHLYKIIRYAPQFFNGIGINNGSVHLDNRDDQVAFTYYK